MDKMRIEQGLAALAASAHRPKMAQFRDVVESVEAALAAGVSRQDVIDELAKGGLELTLSTFASFLQRVRRKPGKVEIPVAPNRGNGAVPNDVPEESTPGSDSQRGVQTNGSNAANAVPDDWLTAELTPAQYRLLSASQKRQKREAGVEQICPNPYKKPV